MYIQTLKAWKDGFSATSAKNGHLKLVRALMKISVMLLRVTFMKNTYLSIFKYVKEIVFICVLLVLVSSALTVFVL